MKINLRVRFQNKVFVTAIITATVSFIYQILSLISIVPSISENDFLSFLMAVVQFLSIAGILHDPTTKGWEDSAYAMTKKTVNDTPMVDGGNE